MSWKEFWVRFKAFLKVVFWPFKEHKHKWEYYDFKPHQMSSPTRARCDCGADVEVITHYVPIQSSEKGVKA